MASVLADTAMVLRCNVKTNCALLCSTIPGKITLVLKKAPKESHICFTGWVGLKPSLLELHVSTHNMEADSNQWEKGVWKGLRFDLGEEVVYSEAQTKAFQLQVKPRNASCKILFFCRAGNMSIQTIHCL